MSEYMRENERGEKWWQLGDIFSVEVIGDSVRFSEECDYYHKEQMSKEEAVATLKSAIEYIEGE